MGIWDTITNAASNLRQGLADEVTKFRSAAFMEAVTAGCAMVASADGTISAAEKQKMASFIKQSDALKVFDFAKVIESFNGWTAKIEFDHTIGRGECLAAIEKLRGKPEARLLVRVCIAIGAADGTFDADEKKVVGSICQVLEINPSEFEL
jgi:tellurite resistance protein TerB